MGQRPYAIAGYGFCINSGLDLKGDEDYDTIRSLDNPLVTVHEFESGSEHGCCVALKESFTRTDWDDVKKLAVPMITEAKEEYLRKWLEQTWLDKPDFCTRLNFPKPEEAKFDWFLYTYFY